MITKLLEMKEVAKQKINEAKSIQELNETKAEYLGKKSPIQALFGQMKDLSVEEKKELGQKINEFKGMIEEEIAKKLEAIKEEEVKTRESKREKPVIQLDKQMNFIAEYPSSTMASQKVNIPSSNIIRCCKVGTHTSAAGYRWMYKDDYNKYKEEY